MSEPKKQAGAVPAPITMSTNASWVKLTKRIAQTELSLKAGNLSQQEQAQLESNLNRDRLKLIEVESNIHKVNIAPTTSAQDRRDADLNRREGQLRAGEESLLEREKALLAKEHNLIALDNLLSEASKALTDREQAFAIRTADGCAPPPTTPAPEIIEALTADSIL